MQRRQMDFPLPKGEISVAHFLVGQAISKLAAHAVLAIKLCLIICAAFFLLLPARAADEPAAIAGSVTDSWSSRGLSGVVVSLRGTTVAVTTDAEGRFQIKPAPPGNQALHFSKSGYQKATVTEIKVLPGQVSRVEVQLKPEFYEMETYEVVAEPFEEQPLEILGDRQKAAAMTDAISSDMFSRVGAGDAAEVVAKVTGATIVDGKYAVIRGLSDRYTATTLNNAEVPTADPYRKSAQLDLFPSKLIDRVVVSKTFTPDQPGSFTGGAINIITKSFPEQFFFNMSVGGEWNSQSSLNPNFLTYPGGGLDWLGMDDGSRALPEALEAGQAIPTPNQGNTLALRSANAATLDSLTRSFKSHYFAPIKSTSLLNHNFSLSVGDKVKFLNRPFGYFAGLSYSHKYNFYDDGLTSRYIAEGNSLRQVLLLNDVRGVDEVAWGAAANLASEIAENHKLSLNFMFNQTAEDEARRQQGFFDRNGQAADGKTYDTISLHYTERNLSALQFKGEHKFTDIHGVKLDWLASFATTTQSEPDLRYFSYFKNPNGFNEFSNELFPTSPSRYFRELEEKNRTLKLDLTIPFPSWSEQDSEIKLGWSLSNSERDYRDRGFAYLSSPGIDFAPFDTAGDPNAFVSPENIYYTQVGNFFRFSRYIRENPPNRYSGQSEVKAGYAMMDLALSSKLRTVGGVRFETTDLTVDSAGGQTRNSAKSSIKEGDWLPAGSLIYSPVSNMNIRASYGLTLARPTYREIAVVETFDFVGGDILVGNPNLRRSMIDNYDLRWEWFPRPGEVFSAGVFYKNLKDPIEQINVDNSGEKISYVNRDQALVYGFELEARKSLDLIHRELKPFSLGVNFAWIESEVELTRTEMGTKLLFDPAASAKRPLFDQSPYIINLDLGYDNERLGTRATLAYNISGRRLAIASAFGPDIYQQPAASLDFILSQKLSKHWSLKFSAKNLLDPEFKRTYGENPQDRLYSTHRKGRSFGLGLSYEF